MKNMPKFQKIQLFLSIIPYASTTAIFFITYWHCMVKYKKKQLNFIIISIVSLIIGGLCYNVLSEYLGYIWSTVIAAVCLWIPNFLLIRIQNKLVLAEPTTPSEKNEISDESLNEAPSTPKNKNSKKKVILIIVGIVATVLIVAAIVAGTIFYVKYQYDNCRILDTNGQEDFTPVTITVEDVINRKKIDENMFFNSSGSGEVDAPEGFSSCHRYSHKSRSYNGYREILKLESKSNTIVIDSTSSVASGNFKMFILIDNEYYKDLNINGTDSITIENANGKVITLYIIGEDANINFEIYCKTKN